MVISDIGRQYLRLHLADAIGPVLLGRLIKHFGTVDAILGASMAQLTEVEGIGERRARSVFESRDASAVEREIEKCASTGARIICWEDPEYPQPLRHCDDPPICLYVRGTLTAEDSVAVAIVGSRKSSRYGYDQARRFGALLAGAGFTVVSGLARGVDSYAHEGALSAGGRTVAVLGSGVDKIYPPEHVDLAERITHAGAVISEDPLGSPPTADSFPRRNRIIAGMCLGVLVVEASKRSGALITARLASEYNREVFAIPGRVDTPTAYGPNDLIRKGAAKLVAGLEDILDELGDAGKTMGAVPSQPDQVKSKSGDTANKIAAALTDNERAILNCLGSDELHIDEIANRSKVPHPKTMSALTMLQLKGAIIALPGSRFARRRD
ncbi:MAG: DNA-protecting protein DprA [Phycisphaerales bacterium]|nr:DNA-protecting protein DprA [Phycisphaerales bacterium]